MWEWYVCVGLSVCLRVGMNECMYVCIWVGLSACMCVGMYLFFVCLCRSVSVHVCGDCLCVCRSECMYVGRYE